MLMTSPMRQTTSRRKIGATMESITHYNNNKINNGDDIRGIITPQRSPSVSNGNLGSVKKERITYFGMLRKNKTNRLVSRCDALRCAMEPSYRNHVIGSTRYVITFLALLFFVSCHLIARRFFLCCKNRGNG